MSAIPTRTPLTYSESTVLVTGGTSGVGLETAMQYAEAGAPRIAINGRNRDRGEAAKQAILDRVPGTRVEFIAGDTNDAATALAVCGKAQETFGPVNILVNSTVGPYGPTLLHDIDLAEMQDIVVKQMMAPLLTSRAVLPGMRAMGTGSIINIASDAGKVATPGETVIGAAMAGIIMFTRGLAIEGKRNGIRANVITPSIIEGTATYASVMAAEFSGKLFSKAIKMAQLGVVRPEDMAAMIVFLGGPQAAKITGQAISVNGGISAA